MEGRDTDNRAPRDIATVLPFLAIVLLVEPVILIFAAPVTVAGIPLIVLYLFGAWGGVILCAFLVARALRRNAGNEPGGLDGRH